MIQVRVVSKKVVKPCIPTPPNLKNYKLSFTDELIPREKVGILLFYGMPPQTQGTLIINSLEESLAKVLVPFYPLAGRLRTKDGYVDCSDQGAEFAQAEAEADAELATLLLERNIQNLDGFMQCNIHGQDEATFPILSIQITHLHCGGLVIGVAVSHKIFDATSLATFIAAWSAATDPAGGDTATIIPVLDSAKVFPAKINIPNMKTPENAEIIWQPSTRTAVGKRFAFNGEAIARLRSKLRPKVSYSRVRVVCPFLAKCLFSVVSSSSRRPPRPCCIVQLINIRERTVPPLSKHACGNLVLTTCTEIVPEFPCPNPDRDMGMQEWVDQMSEAIDKGIAECGEMLRVGEDRLREMMVEPRMKAGKALMSGDLLWFTDWSKCGFYDVDFGWGKPVWASVVGNTQINGVALMGNKEGNGVEAWVFLDKDDMAKFEQDEEIRLLCNLDNI